MVAFVWDSSFLTGIDKVDEQHFHLVSLINKFGELLVNNELCESNVETVFQELYQYTDYHFQEEEALMVNAGISKQFLAQHIGIHKDFLAKISVMHNDISLDDLGSLKMLLDFLIHWLVYHILGMDKSTAQQIKAIQNGNSADQAFIVANTEVHNATEALLSALNNLFSQVSERNKELHQLNKMLETRVEQRTKALQEANKHLEEIAVTDSLTNLPNRRYAMHLLNQLWEQADFVARPLACLMIDADNFKEVNDKYGHDAGDKVLVALSQTLQQSVRNDDTVCRLGGDEFLVICENTHYDGGKYLAQLLSDVVAKLKVNTGKGSWLGSVSVGLGSQQQDMQNIEALIKMADKGVYLAKEAGKGCVRCIC
jgi:hemerythrin